MKNEILETKYVKIDCRQAWEGEPFQCKIVRQEDGAIEREKFYFRANNRIDIQSIRYPEYTPKILYLRGKLTGDDSKIFTIPESDIEPVLEALKEMEAHLDNKGKPEPEPEPEPEHNTKEALTEKYKDHIPEGCVVLPVDKDETWGHSNWSVSIHFPKKLGLLWIDPNGKGNPAVCDHRPWYDSYGEWWNSYLVKRTPAVLAGVVWKDGE